MALPRLRTYARTAYLPLHPRLVGVARLRPDQRGWGGGWQPDGTCPAQKLRAALAVQRSDGRVFTPTVRRELAALAQYLFDSTLALGYELRKRGEPDGGVGSYNCRAIKDSNPPVGSWHSWALAFDVNSKGNPKQSTTTGWRSTTPPEVVELWESAGWYWGGRYEMADPMHFEYLGQPQDAADDLARATATMARLRPPQPALAELMAVIKQIESSGRQFSQDPRSGASGFYGFMPKNWRITASRVLGTDRTQARAENGLDPREWQPPMTVENQEAVALSEFKRLARRFDGDLRKIAASWSWGEGRVAKTPIEEWPRKPIVYSNNAVVPLGLDPLPVPDKVTEPPPEPEPSEQVEALQTFLNAPPFNFELVVDGVYGPATDAALKAATVTVEALRAQLDEKAKAALS